MILGQKEESMNVEAFIALGRNRIALRGYTEHDIQTGMGLLDITTWTILEDNVLVHANYTRCVALTSGRSLGRPYNIEIAFREGSRLKTAARSWIEYAAQNWPYRGFLVRNQVAYTRFVKQFDNTPAESAHTYHYCDPLFATHLKVMHALCSDERGPVEEAYRAALVVFKQRLGALIHENDTMISRGALFPMF